MIKVKQLANNQFIVKEGDVQYFQSYDSIIAKRLADTNAYIEPTKTLLFLDKTYWNYSKTTSKYRNQFLGETTKETQAKIDSGEYVLTALNA